MSIAEQVSKIERDLAARGWSPDDLCRKAGINRSTWTRWKSGVVIPNLATWQKVEECLPAFDGVKPQSGGAPGARGAQAAAV